MKNGGGKSMQVKDRLIYKEIKFQAAPFSYDLKFFARITLVRGYSATGKTYLYNLFSDLRLTKEFNKIVLFNYKTDNFVSELRKVKNSFVVIDNGDILIDDKIKAHINFDKSNQYLLFLRNCDGLNLSQDSFTVLHKSDNHITIEKEFKL